MGVFGPGRMIQVFSLFDILLSWGAVLAPLSTSETTYLDSLLINRWQAPQLDTELPNQKDAPSESWRGILQVYRRHEWGPARLCTRACSLFDVH